MSRNTTHEPRISRSLECSALVGQWLENPSQEKEALLVKHVTDFYHSAALNCPKSSHLLTLTRVNVYRAFVSNMVLLSISWDWMDEDSIYPFAMVRPGSETANFPGSLPPTALQRSRVHHTWIDLFPSPIIRDNLLKRGNDWDDEELCTDIMGFWEGNSTGPNGLIVWGEPSDPSNWEVTEGFIRKWGWVVKGCGEVLRATNYWRAKRGEEPLYFPV